MNRISAGKCGRMAVLVVDGVEVVVSEYRLQKHDHGSLGPLRLVPAFLRSQLQVHGAVPMFATWLLSKSDRQPSEELLSKVSAATAQLFRSADWKSP